MFCHLFVEEKTANFYEMLLHHTATCSLCFGYMFSNYMGIGAIISFVHDPADIFGNACKMFNCTIYNKTALINFLITMVVWAWTRNFGLAMLVYPIWVKYRYPPWVTTDDVYFYYHITCIAVFLSTLLFLHYFWYILFLRVIWSVITTGDSEDKQDSVEDRHRQKSNKVE